MVQTGQRIEGFEVEDLVGEGGMASVFRVRDRDTGEVFALKVLTLRHPDIEARFRREADTQASLNHPGIVGVKRWLDHDGDPALLMDFVDGIALDEWVRRHPDMPASARDDLARQIIEAVGYAHAEGVVHRDLKPGNVLVNHAGGLLQARITDFGLAKVLNFEPSATRSGIALGTPRYMAPEQIHDAKSVDHRADIFSLGALLYELYLGRPAFHQGALLDIFQAVVDGDYEAPEGQIDPRVASAIRGALQADRDRRIPDCETLLAVLLGREGWVTPEPAPVREVAADNSTLDVEPLPLPRPPPPPVAAVPARRRGSRRWVWAWAAALALVCVGWLAAATVAGALVVGAAALPATPPSVERPRADKPMPPARPRPKPRPKRGRR